jgi:hypothetical protein
LIRRTSSLAVVLGAAAAVPRVARAAGPTVAECLAASEASLQAGNARKRLAEREHLVACAEPSCPKVIREECERRLDEVNRRISTVVFDIRDAGDHPVTEVTIIVDGRVLAAHVSDEPVPLDPGEHHFLFRALGQPELARDLVIREAERDRQIRIRVGEKKAPPSPASRPLGRATASSARSQRVVALVSTGVAAVGLGAGTVFGLRALSQRNQARGACPEACAESAGVEAWENARRSGNYSTASFIMAGVAGAAAAVLWLTLPTPSSTRVGFGLGTAALASDF